MLAKKLQSEPAVSSSQHLAAAAAESRRRCGQSVPAPVQQSASAVACTFHGGDSAASMSSGFSIDTVVKFGAGVLGLGVATTTEEAALQVELDTNAVPCPAMRELMLTNAAAKVAASRVSQFVSVCAAFVFAYSFISVGGLKGDAASELDMIVAWCCGSGAVLLSAFMSSLRRVTASLDLDTWSGGGSLLEELNLEQFEQDSVDSQNLTDSQNPLHEECEQEDHGTTTQSDSPRRTGVYERENRQYHESASVRKLHLHGSVAQMIEHAEKELDKTGDGARGCCIAQGHLEDLGAGTVLISRSALARLKVWANALSVLSVVVVLTGGSMIGLALSSVEVTSELMRWGTMGIYTATVGPCFIAWWMTLQMASCLVADAVVEARRSIVRYQPATPEWEDEVVPRVLVLVEDILPVLSHGEI